MNSDRYPIARAWKIRDILVRSYLSFPSKAGHGSRRIQAELDSASGSGSLQGFQMYEAK